MSKIKNERVGVIFNRDFKEYKSGKSFKILMAVYMLITIVISIKILLSSQGDAALKLTLCNTLFLLALVPTIVNIPIFTTVPLTRDKINGTMANLLATPLCPKEIVHGKSLAIFFPGYIISVLNPLLIMLVVNFVLIVPADGSLYMPLPLLLTIFVITPIFVYGLTEFTIQLSMIKSPELAISPSYLIGFALMIGIPICSATGAIDLTSWSFVLLYLGAAFLMWILVWSLSLLLTKERIILSN